MPTAPKPIFIHSLFRSGSTYLFTVFRRSAAGYWCYQEPFNEILNHLNGNPQVLLDFNDETARLLRHPALSQPYFFEFFEIREHLKAIFKPSFSYAEFFADPEKGNSEDVKTYLRLLLTHAKGRAVLQFCRSAGRARAFKKEFNALHLHLWRDPRDQWWSYKATRYFDATTQIIYQAKNLPPVLRRIRELASLGDLPFDDVPRQFDHAIRNPLPSSGSYLSFYGLWLYAFLECEAVADVSISIDRLNHEGSYRDAVLKSLEEKGVSGIDLSDCHITRSEYQRNEKEFFESLERQVRVVFGEFGYTSDALRSAALAQQSTERCLPHPNPDLGELASRARRLVLDHDTEWAQTQRRLVEVEQQLAAKATELAQAQQHLVEVEGQLAIRTAEEPQTQQRLAEVEEQLAACQQAMTSRWHRSAAWMSAHSGGLRELERRLRGVLRKP